jgi:poly(3-hydroxybutyrate) depolymerase
MQLRSLAILFVTAFALVEAICPSRTPPGENEITVQVGGMSRQFYVYVPRDMPDTPSEGVVMIHGCGSSPEKFELESQMNVNAAEKKWFNVYPLGTSTGTTLGWNAGTGSCRTGGIPNDVDFMRAVVLYMVEVRSTTVSDTRARVVLPPYLCTCPRTSASTWSASSRPASPTEAR